MDVWGLFVRRQDINHMDKLALTEEVRRQGRLHRGCAKLKAAF